MLAILCMITATTLLGSVLCLIYMQMMISFVLDKQGFPALQRYRTFRFYIWGVTTLRHIDPYWLQKKNISDWYLRTHLVFIVMVFASILLAPIGMIEFYARKFRIPSLIAI